MTIPGGLISLMMGAISLTKFETGWTFVGTGSVDTSAGTVSWTTPGNITASDDSDAVANTGGATTFWLKGTNLGFAIPAGAIIDGIEFRVEGAYTAVAPTTIKVSIVKSDASIGSEDKGGVSPLTTSDALYTYGGAVDLWSETWSASDINDVDFGVVIAFVGGLPTIDAFEMNVHYKA